jgi:hypothetical protein
LKKDIVRYALGLAAFGGLASAWACFSNTTGTPGATSTGTDTGGAAGGTASTSTGGGASSSSAAGGSSAASSSATTVAITCPVGSTGNLGDVLDDMASIAPDGTGLNGGSWYTYDDRSIPNSEPPQILTPAPPGTVTPAEGDSFPATATGPNIDMTTGAILASGGMATVAREGMGGGETNWGAGFGMDLMGEQPDGGPVPLNSCDAGMIFDTNPMPDSGKYTGIPLPFDAVAHGYTGFQFYGMSKTATQAVDVHVADQRSMLWAGQCSVCQPTSVKCTLGGGLSSCPCNDDFVETVTFTTAWKHFTVKWKDSQIKGALACFKPAGWSNEVTDKIITVGTADAGIEANAIYNIHFQFNTSTGKALTPFDVLVAYFTWTTD